MALVTGPQFELGNTTTMTGWSNQPTIWVNAQPVTPSPPSEETKKETIKKMSEVAGAAPCKSLFVTYTRVVGGYIGQIKWGNPEGNDTSAVVLWQSDPIQPNRDNGGDSSAKSKAMGLAEDRLLEAMGSLFTPTTS